MGDTAIVLLGDAAHTAHFSVGSGTKMAMEDAIALADMLGEVDSTAPAAIDAALEVYEARRRPEVDNIQNSARPSLSWWEHFGRTFDSMPGWQFAYHFFTRSLTDGRLNKRAPAFIEDSHAAWRESFGAEPLRTSLTVGRAQVGNRRVRLDDGAVVVGETVVPLRTEAADAGEWALAVSAPPAEDGLAPVLEILAKGAASGADLVVVSDGSPLTRRLVCEAARLEYGLVSLLVEATEDQRYGADDTAVTAVLSGRTDLVAEPSIGGVSV